MIVGGRLTSNETAFSFCPQMDSSCSISNIVFELLMRKFLTVNGFFCLAAFLMQFYDGVNRIL